MNKKTINNEKETGRSTEKRKQIIMALYECLGERGQEKVSVKDIANKAGVPHGIIHYYFKSKDDIVTELGEYIVYSLIKQMEKKLENVSKEKALFVVIDFIIESLIFDRKLGYVFYNLIQMTFERESLRSVMIKMFRNYREQMAAFFQKIGLEKADIYTGMSLVAITEGIGLQVLMDPSAFTKKEIQIVLKKLVSSIFLVEQEKNLKGG